MMRLDIGRTVSVLCVYGAVQWTTSNVLTLVCLLRLLVVVAVVAKDLLVCGLRVRHGGLEWGLGGTVPLPTGDGGVGGEMERNATQRNAMIVPRGT